VRALVAVAALAFLAGCATARRGEPLRGPMTLNAKQARGESTFKHICNGCHPGGEGGLGPGLNNKPLPGFMIKYQVRHGVGVMPHFPKERISDEALDDLVAYMKHMRGHR
jgi:mono/diheme cytochrome c family protein